MEAKGFRDRIQDFENKNVVVLGISTDVLEDNAEFRKKTGLPFPLLSDTKKEVCLAYGSCAFASAYYSDRITFVIDPEGIIRKVYPKVEISNHIEEVLQFLSNQ